MPDTALKKLNIDREICVGHGRCYALAPDSFTADDLGYGVPNLRPQTDRSDSEIEDIVGACPEEAILVEDADGA